MVAYLPMVPSLVDFSFWCNSLMDPTVPNITFAFSCVELECELFIIADVIDRVAYDILDFILLCPSLFKLECKLLLIVLVLLLLLLFAVVE